MPDSLTDVDNVLAVDNQHQLDLLEAIWRPFESGQGWPIWDYVARTLYRTAPQLPDAGAIWRSLPRFPRAQQIAPYGAVWATDGSMFEPPREARVGLSIAGLSALSDRSALALASADAIAQLIGTVGSWERQLAPNLHVPVSLEMTLEQSTKEAFAAPGLDTIGFNTAAIYETLRREYISIPVHDTESQRGAINLGIFIAPYHDIRDAATYLERILVRATPRNEPEHMDPLALADALDHLALAVQADSSWDGRALVRKIDLRAAGTLALTAKDAAEYRDRLSCLAILLDALDAPDLPQAVIDSTYAGKVPKSLTRLQYWLEQRLDGSPALGPVLEALGDIRAAVRLRNDGQHSGTSLRADARKARLRLGLPEVVYDYGGAWAIARARVADAVHLIRRSLREEQQSP